MEYKTELEKLRHRCWPRIFLIFLSLLFLETNEGFSYLCQQKTAQKAYEDADIVFSGKVIKVVEKEMSMANVVFDVFTIWKGSYEKNITLNQSSITKGGEYLFETAQEYLVYAFKKNNEIVSGDVCSGTKKLSEAGADLDVLARGITEKITILPEDQLCQKDEDCDRVDVDCESVNCEWGQPVNIKFKEKYKKLLNLKKA